MGTERERERERETGTHILTINSMRTRAARVTARPGISTQSLSCIKVLSQKADFTCSDLTPHLSRQPCQPRYSSPLLLIRFFLNSRLKRGGELCRTWRPLPGSGQHTTRFTALSPGVINHGCMLMNQTPTFSSTSSPTPSV